MKSRVRLHSANWQVSKKLTHANHGCDGDDDDDVNVDDVSVYDVNGHLHFALNRQMMYDCCFLLHSH